MSTHDASRVWSNKLNRDSSWTVKLGLSAALAVAILLLGISMCGSDGDFVMVPRNGTHASEIESLRGSDGLSSTSESGSSNSLDGGSLQKGNEDALLLENDSSNTDEFETVGYPSEAVPPIVVHVAGAVTEPGVFELPPGSRVEAAVAAAGGMTSDAAPSSINLARVLSDGEQVVIPTIEEAKAGLVLSAASGDEASSVRMGKVNLNTASADLLESLPGIGPALAQRIIDDRIANGPFVSNEDLMRVSGIGQKKFDQLASYICV